MFNRYACLIVVAAGLLLCSCGKKSLSEKELKRYVLDESNGLRKTIHHDDYEVAAIFRPSDLMVKQALGVAADTAGVSRLRQRYGSHYYFILNISKNNRDAISTAALSPDDFGFVLENVSFRMPKFVNLTTDKRDTVALADFLYNRTFGMGASSEVLLIFDKTKLRDSEWIQINMSELGLGIGVQNFRFKRSLLDDAPSIDFKKML